MKVARGFAAFLVITIAIAGAISAHATAMLLEKFMPLEKYMTSYNGTAGIPLERYLWQSGIYPINYVSIGSKTIDWTDAAYRSFRYIPVLVNNGSISAFGKPLYGNLNVGTAPKPAHTIMDIAPTVSEALGMGEDQFDGSPLVNVRASKVVVIYIDALGWYRYKWAESEEKNLSELGPPIIASSVYPSISVVNAAAMVTGVSPEKSGIDRWENRTLLVNTVFESAKKDGVSAAWVDWPKPPLPMRDWIVTVPDNGGDTDATVVDKAISEYRNGTQMIYLHIVKTDYVLHHTGPYSPESWEAIGEADALVGRLLQNMEPGTLVIAVADHGGHDIMGGKGDHGTLLPQDMLIPVFVKLYQTK